MKKSEEIALHKEIRKSFKFDPMQMLFREDYHTQSGIIVRQPCIGELMEIGEEKFYRSLNVWLTNPTSWRMSLWHMGVDWCKITDFELFISLFKGAESDVMRLVLPEINISTYEPKYRVIGEEQYETVIYSEQEDQVIDNMTYLEISQYLRTLFNIFPKDEYAKGKATKEAIIFEDEMNAAKDKNEGYKSSLFPLISSCINYPGFKHSLSDLRTVGIFEFMDSVNRIQIAENTKALLVGSMSSFADTSKVPKENFNFMRDYTIEKKREFTQQQKDKFNSLTTMS